MRYLCLLALLAACRNKPVDVVAEIEIIPAKAGDHVELYFGTNPRQGHLTETAANQLAIDQVQAYAVDKIGPHVVGDVPADLVVDISEPLPNLSMVIAFEQEATYAAATAIDLSDASAPVYVLKLEPVDQATGIDAAEWGPSNPTADQAAKECAYYNGPDADGNPLTAAIVVDIDTATTVTPYVDLDCDGYHAVSNSNGPALECNDHDYDSMGQAADDSTCVATFLADDDCVVVGPACNDGKMTPLGCPDAIAAQNLTKWCVPTGYCTDAGVAYTSLADMIAMPLSSAGAIVCDVEVDLTSGQPCEQMLTAIGDPTLALCSGAPEMDVEIGAGGPPYDTDAMMPNTMDAKVSIAQQSQPCTFGFSLEGDWTALALNPTGPPALMLAVTPDGFARGLVLPLVFEITPLADGEMCTTSSGECMVAIPTAAADQNLTTCLNAP